MAAEQRKTATATAGNPATASTDAADKPEPAPKVASVKLAVRHPHALFDLTAQDLPSVTQAGTVYTTDQADTVRMLAHKYGVPLTEVPTNEEN